MQNCNSEFFDEFKRLDKLCREIYGRSAENKLGVTLYLEDMDSKGRRGARVEGWTSDYNRLKRVRAVRNELAHSTDTFSRRMCNSDDVEFIRAFYARILNGTDPLSLYRKEFNSSRDEKNRSADKLRSIASQSGRELLKGLSKKKNQRKLIGIIKRIFRFFSKIKKS